MGKKICIIQTGTASSEELMTLCAEMMPEVSTYQIIDDSLLKEISAVGGLTPSVNRRMYAYCMQAQEMGADAILHHCVAAADVVGFVQPFLDIPVIRIDEGMAHQAVRAGRRIAVFGTSMLAMKNSVRLLKRVAAEEKRQIDITGVHLLEDARNTVRQEAEMAGLESDAIVLAQPSMTALLPLLEGIGTPIFDPVRSGIGYLKMRLEGTVPQGGEGN